MALTQPRYFATATGYDDTTFQEAIRGQSEEAFFSKFRLFTPAERTAAGTTWTVHMMFRVTEQASGSDSAGHGLDEFISVPSKMVVPTDGPLQVLQAGKRRRIEMIMQAATQTHWLSRCKRVLFGAPRVADRYPSNIDERRKSYQAMMQGAKELKVLFAPQANPTLHCPRNWWPKLVLVCRYRSRWARTQLRSRFRQSGRRTRCLSQA